MSNTIYNNNFNLIRILAATQVLIIHTCNHYGYDSWFINALRCFPGVPIFFFTSGFLIGTTFIKNQEKGLKVFYINRFLRLYPALWFCIILSLFSVYVSGYFDEASFSISNFLTWILAQGTFLQFYNPEFMRDYGVGVLNGSLWTIAVEIQFYLLTPILYFFSRLRFPFNFMLFIISILINVWLIFNNNWDNYFVKLLFVSFIPWIYMFLIGFYIAKNKSLTLHWVKKVNIWVVLLAYIVSMNFIGNYKVNSSDAIHPIAVILLSILVFKFAYMNLQMPQKIRDYLNKYDLSYGVYIYHMPIINLLLFNFSYFGTVNKIFITIASTFILALVSWVFLESRVLKLKK
ncbi:acyltransferase family protein [Sphingobacterium bovistauri]|uniref:Acyltransferase n=1 Tax=Sphingobacterium bovistauri TaxID=2781959 RepID=A0ABS7Z3U0_9SPHI|nr:acyltransferase [Sphingobacterium bovistauri]MCA5004091.1 acyltransferase [Sphingobacterium bovistauri]